MSRYYNETITILLRVRKNLMVYGRGMALCDMHDEIREVFHILRRDHATFKIIPSRAKGLLTIA